MDKRPFKIRMNPDGAILKIKEYGEDTFSVMPDYITLEKASYPRMLKAELNVWDEEISPPENYGENIIDDTFEESLYYTFYCDSVSWDGNYETQDKSGNGSKENPWIHHPQMQLLPAASLQVH